MQSNGSTERDSQTGDLRSRKKPTNETPRFDVALMQRLLQGAPSPWPTPRLPPINLSNPSASSSSTVNSSYTATPPPSLEEPLQELESTPEEMNHFSESFPPLSPETENTAKGFPGPWEDPIFNLDFSLPDLTSHRSPDQETGRLDPSEFTHDGDLEPRIWPSGRRGKAQSIEGAEDAEQGNELSPKRQKLAPEDGLDIP